MPCAMNPQPSMCVILSEAKNLNYRPPLSRRFFASLRMTGLERSAFGCDLAPR
jgi:hypothetical protein